MPLLAVTRLRGQEKFCCELLNVAASERRVGNRTKSEFGRLPLAACKTDSPAKTRAALRMLSGMCR